jgi:hypothetical protein
MMTSQHRKPRGQLLGAAWEVAAHYRAHDGYGSESKACKALQRRCSGFTARQYRNAFAKAVALYDGASDLLARHARELCRQTDVTANRFPNFSGLTSKLRGRCPGFRVSAYQEALNWVFFWNHLK